MADKERFMKVSLQCRVNNSLFLMLKNILAVKQKQPL